MNRPTELHLLPDEVYPVQRDIYSEIADRPIVIRNMTQMADFVFKLYMKKVEAMKEAMVSRVSINFLGFH